MKKPLFILLIFFSAEVNAQTIIYSEDFEGVSHSFNLNTTAVNSAGGAGYNQWVINNSFNGGSGTLNCLGFPFSFSVPATPGQPGSFNNGPTSKYMHITSVEAVNDGIFCSSFLAADGICFLAENNFASMSADISTLGMLNVTLSFWWLCAGSANNYGQLYYSIDSGVNWSLVSMPLSNYQGSSSWSQTIITDPVFNNRSTIRFGFRFVNQVTTVAADPAFSIDEIFVSNACNPNSDSADIFACDSYTVPSGDETYFTSGIYSDTIMNQGGCDSVITINLNVPLLDTIVIANGPVLTSQASGVNYQWLDCDNNMIPIPGETNQTYIAPPQGAFVAVIVSDSICSDTSACIPALSTSVDAHRNFESINIFPNPVKDILCIKLDQPSDDFEVKLYSLDGRVLMTRAQRNSAYLELALVDFAAGTYILRVISRGHVSFLNIVKAQH